MKFADFIIQGQKIMSIILDKPEQINLYRLKVLLIGLETEIKFKGMQLTRGRTCYARIKSEFGFKGNKKKVYDQFKIWIDNHQRLLKFDEIEIN